MRWYLHTSRPALAAELRDVLEGDRVHYERMLLKKYARNLLSDELPTERQAVDDEITRQMHVSISAACHLALEMSADPTTLFVASLSGHVDPTNRDGVKERLTVAVDIAPPESAIPELVHPPNPAIA